MPIQSDREEVRRRIAKLPYYHSVPKDFRENLAFRMKILDWAAESAANRKALIIACSQDILFYLNVFSWVHEPRLMQLPEFPLITWDFQDEAIMALVMAIEQGRDVHVEKSREMGGSWNVAIVLEWMARFHKRLSFLILSRKEDLVDSPGDMSSLFQKIDFIHAHLPSWLRPARKRNALHMEFLDGHSTIEGESTNDYAGTGGRYTCIFMDEFPLFDNADAILQGTQYASKCRIVLGTVNGVNHAFYDIRTRPRVVRIRLHWTLHPGKIDGLYRDKDGRLRSRYYDREVERANSPYTIATQLDIDYGAQRGEFMKPEILERVRRDYIAPEWHRGSYTFAEHTLESPQWVEEKQGSWKLWYHPGFEGVPPKGKYIIGADVATGNSDQGAGYDSNSCLSVINYDTSEKIAEYICPKVMAHKFAEIAVVACRLFVTDSGVPAKLIWESNGPGGTFGQTAMELGHTHIYYHQSTDEKGGKPSYKPGFLTSNKSRTLILSELLKGYDNGKFVQRSMEALNDARNFRYEGDDIVHSASRRKDDPSGAGQNHGDITIADALGWWLAKDRILLLERKREEVEKTPPLYSPAWFMLRDKQRSREQKRWKVPLPGRRCVA